MHFFQRLNKAEYLLTTKANLLEMGSAKTPHHCSCIFPAEHACVWMNTKTPCVDLQGKHGDEHLKPNDAISSGQAEGEASL